jgi:hypothetical protein
MTRQHTVHHWAETNATTRVATAIGNSLYVVTAFRNGEFLDRLSNTERPGSVPSAEQSFGSTRIAFLDASNRPAAGTRTLLEVAQVGRNVWIVASDGIYVVVKDRAYWIAGPPADREILATRRQQSSDVFFLPLLLPYYVATVETSDYAFRYLAESGSIAGSLSQSPEQALRKCRDLPDCHLGLTLGRLASAPEGAVLRLANSSASQKLEFTRRGSESLPLWVGRQPGWELNRMRDLAPLRDMFHIAGHGETNGKAKRPNLDEACGSDVALKTFEGRDGVFLWHISVQQAQPLLSGHFERVSAKTPWGIPGHPGAEPPRSSQTPCRAFLFTERGTYKVDGERASLISEVLTNSISHDVFPLRLSGTDHFLFFSTAGVFESRAASVSRLESRAASAFLAATDRDLSVWLKTTPTGNVWITTATGVFLLNNRVHSLDRAPDHELSTPHLQRGAGHEWIVTPQEVYEVFDQAAITVSLESDGISEAWKQLVHLALGPDAFVSGTYSVRVHYVDAPEANSLPPRLSDSRFDYIAASSRAEFEHRVEHDRYSTEDTLVTLPIGLTTLYFKLRDAEGNVSWVSRRLWVAPSEYVLPLLLVVLWICLTTTVLVLAPYSRVLQLAVMNPRLRTVGSFFLIPLLLSLFPWLGRHLLRPYEKALRQDRALREAALTFVPPAAEFAYDVFCRALLEQRKVLLVGRSGLGKTTLLRYLCYHCTASPRSPGAPHLVPVLIPLVRYQSLEPAKMFALQLATYGDLHDEELADWFLRQGGFAVFLDGLNEISATARARINTFVDAISSRNLVCVSSQLKYEEFHWLSTCNLMPLSDPEIRQILSRTLEPEALEAFFAQMDAGMREIYGAPQNLVFAEDIIRRGGVLPRTRYELYRAVFQPIEERWIAQGFREAASTLYRRAFDMLTLGQPYFESADFTAPSVIVSELIEHKLLARTGEQLMFTHDLVRAFLAANFFMERWQTDSAIWERRADRNWLPMVEFCVTEFASAAHVEALLGYFLRCHPPLAAEVYKLVQGVRPWLLTAEVREGFLRQYGEAVL